MKTQSNAEAVREFTKGAGQPTPDTPKPMTKKEVFFLSKMMLDEIMEFCATVASPEEAKKNLCSFIEESKDIEQEDYSDDKDNVRLVADQADALLDSYYYSLNAAAKAGVNLSSVFDIVHAANMAKRDPATGEFLKRADGKIIKPKGWKPPDVNAEVERQMRVGAWEDTNKEN